MQKLKEPKISKICVIISFIILVASVSVLFHKGTKGENFDTKNLVQNTIFRLVAVTSEYFSDKNPLSSIKTAEINYQKHSRLNKDTIAQNRERERERVKNVIVIIGESLSRHYMSLYGYEKPTTPFLKNLEKSGNLISFSDIISPYTSTNPVLEYALNFNNYESKDKRHYSDSLNMLDMFNLAGYKTFWISNQEFNGRYTMATTSISARADEIKFTGSLGTRNSFRYDSEILQFLSNKTDGFYIIHLMGSHSLYRERYPDEYAKFKSNELNEPLNKKQKDRLAKYLNSVFYNDFIINEIYKVFKDDDSLILYFSDHGESLYEFKGLSGHGFVTRFTCEIPFMFIASDEFKTKHGELWQKIQEAKDKPFMTDDLPHTLADIIGVKPLEYDENRSLISPNFNTLRKRIMQGVDYETIKNQKAYE
ncbi:phosphoethanolamine transferase [Campylobacter sp. 9BO]|uniref:phosphoethanolamine transferase n=1 Tax=Campylobacter sp. 9BO TaxID=3424759 RepID=UPI003D35613E